MTDRRSKKIFKFFLAILHFFLSSFSFLLFLSKLLCIKKHHACNLYCRSSNLSFCYVMYYIVSEICIVERFLEYCSANESLIPYNLIKRAPEAQNPKYCNAKCHPKPNQKYIKYSSLEKKIL